MTKPTVAVDAAYLKEIEKARRELRALISAKNCAPLMLRLACHDAGTYDADTRTGGPNGSIKSKDELNHKANKGLEEAVEFCEKVKEKCPKITYADLYQLAGVVAVEVTGGPTIDFVPGRKDSLGTPTLARLPDADQDAQQLREVFHRMGLSDDKDIVALSVCYTLGGAGFEGPWTSNPPKFDNSYFKELLPPEKAPGQSLPADKPEAPLHTDKPEAPLHTDKPQAPLHTDKPQAPLSTDKRQAPPPTAKPRDLLPIEKALLDDREFHKHVERYAKDEDAFFKDYAASHKKLSELGFKLKHVGDHRVMHGVIGLFIASTVAILGYLFQVKRSSKRGDYY